MFTHEEQLNGSLLFKNMIVSLQRESSIGCFLRGVCGSSCYLWDVWTTIVQVDPGGRDGEGVLHTAHATLLVTCPSCTAVISYPTAGQQNHSWSILQLNERNNTCSIVQLDWTTEIKLRTYEQLDNRKTMYTLYNWTTEPHMFHSMTQVNWHI